jgi:hypothetical protein
MASFQHGRVLHLSTLTVPITATPTTTYPFTYTTAGLSFYEYTGGSDTYFPTPSSLPPTATPFAAREECCNRSSLIPEDPTSQNASCAISNSACDNPHAFWDLYACCNGAEVKEAGLSGSGEFNGCQATCDAVGQSWQDLSACLEQRVKIVVCKPDDSEIAGGRSTSTSSEAAATITTSGTSTASTTECVAQDANGLRMLTCLPSLSSTPSVNLTYEGSASRVATWTASSFEVVSAVFVIVSLGSMLGAVL